MLSIAGGIVGVATGLGVAPQLAVAFRVAAADPPRIIIIAVGFSRVRRHRLRAVSRRARRRAWIRSRRCGSNESPARRRGGRACSGGRRLARAGADGRRSDVARGAVPRDRAAHRAPAAAAAAPGARADRGGRGARGPGARAAAAAGEPHGDLLTRDEQLRAATRRDVGGHESHFRPIVHHLQLLEKWHQRDAADLGLRPGLAEEETPRVPPPRLRRTAERATQLSADLAIRSAFYQARATRDAVGVARETLANRIRTRRPDPGVHRGRHAAEIDLLQARTDQANAEVALINAQNDYATARAILNQTMGVEAAPPATRSCGAASGAAPWRGDAAGDAGR